jgi:hypothetical protein
MPNTTRRKKLAKKQPRVNGRFAKAKPVKGENQQQQVPIQAVQPGIKSEDSFSGDFDNEDNKVTMDNAINQDDKLNKNKMKRGPYTGNGQTTKDDRPAKKMKGPTTEHVVKGEESKERVELTVLASEKS